MTMTRLSLTLILAGLFTFSTVAQCSEKAFNVLLNYGFKSLDLVSVVKKYPELKNLNSIYDAKLNQNQYIIYAEENNSAYVFTKSSNELKVEHTDVTYETEVKGISGSIRQTVYDSILDDTKSELVAAQVQDAFKDEFPHLRVGRVSKSYKLQVEHQYVGDKFIRYGKVLSAALIIGKATSRRIYQLNSEDYTWALLPENLNRADKPFYLPVDAQRVTSLFQLNRNHPLTRRHQPHKGIDFASPNGSNIYPALDGVVVTIARSRSKGKFVTVKHDNGYETTYIHLKKVQPYLKVGMRVELGEKIGEVGRTGFSTGAHLHFGVIQDGLFINPIYLMKGYSYNHRIEHETKLLSKKALELKDLSNEQISLTEEHAEFPEDATEDISDDESLESI